MRTTVEPEIDRSSVARREQFFEFRISDSAFQEEAPRGFPGALGSGRLSKDRYGTVLDQPLVSPESKPSANGSGDRVVNT